MFSSLTPVVFSLLLDRTCGGHRRHQHMTEATSIYRIYVIDSDGIVVSRRRSCVVVLVHQEP